MSFYVLFIIIIRKYFMIYDFMSISHL